MHSAALLIRMARSLNATCKCWSMKLIKSACLLQTRHWLKSHLFPVYLHATKSATSSSLAGKVAIRTLYQLYIQLQRASIHTPICLPGSHSMTHKLRIQMHVLEILTFNREWAPPPCLQFKLAIDTTIYYAIHVAETIITKPNHADNVNSCKTNLHFASFLLAFRRKSLISIICFG